MTIPSPHGAEMRQLLDAVQQRAELPSTTESERLVRATISTLAERITTGQVEDIRAFLPEDLHADFAQRSGHAESFGKREFLDRVSREISATDLDETEKQVVTVCGVLGEWVPDDQLESAAAQLPADLARLFR